MHSWPFIQKLLYADGAIIVRVFDFHDVLKLLLWDPVENVIKWNVLLPALQLVDNVNMFLFQSNVLLYSGSLDHTPVFFIGQLPIPVLVSFLKTDLVNTASITYSLSPWRRPSETAALSCWSLSAEEGWRTRPCSCWSLTQARPWPQLMRCRVSVAVEDSQWVVSGVAGCLGAIEHNLAKCQNKHYLPHMAVLTKTSNFRSKRLSHLHLFIEHKYSYYISNRIQFIS